MSFRLVPVTEYLAVLRCDLCGDKEICEFTNNLSKTVQERLGWLFTPKGTLLCGKCVMSAQSGGIELEKI